VTLLVWLPCPHHCPRLTFPWGSHRWRLDHPWNRGWRIDRPQNRGWRIDRPQNRGWRSNHHPRRSDQLALRSTIVACFTNFSRAPCGAHDSDCVIPGPDIHDSDHATCGPCVLVLPATLLASPSGYATATSAASTSALPADEGHISDAPSQPSSDDHASEAGFLTTDHQNHHVDHFIVGLDTNALLRPCHPRRFELALHHGKRICCLDHQQHMRSCPSPHWLQRRHR
jgi:hypothetical protein